ncbi:MAG: carbohydrate-binding domain-containing protein [Caldilineaceae bacterium]|nr:carbohydrate-binding domain-containing protein [Caldilineaceae bacterium]
MRKLLLPAIIVLILAISACVATNTNSNGNAADDTGADNAATASQTAASAEDASSAAATAAETTVTEVAEEQVQTAPPAQVSAATASIMLADDGITTEGDGVAVDGAIVTVSAAGVYHVTGASSNGQIVVDSDEEGDVVLLLDGVDIAYAGSAPIFVSNADNAVITLVDGTQNTVTDSAEYLFPDAETDEPNAAIFSDDDLLINGGGSLMVTGNYNHGIYGKDDLEIDLTPNAGSLSITAVNDGLKGKDSLVVYGGDITINADGDGMQSNNDEDPEKGVITIWNGTLAITAGEDGIQAETDLTVNGGVLNLTTGGGSGFTAADSAKGLKAGVNLTISGGEINVDSADDTVHSNDAIIINDGSLQLASGDDGVHADASLEINAGQVIVTKSYEGLESAIITLNGGTIRVVASDDGINVAGGADGSAMGGRPGQNQFAATNGQYLAINGGVIYVDASGDGLDANGSIHMTGGQVIVNGPVANNNGALDYDGTFDITGGILVAAGSAGMAQAPGLDSTQNSVLYAFSAVQPAGTLIHVKDAAGNNILTFAPLRDYQSVAISSPALVDGATYTIYSGGSATGTAQDGLYTGGSYSGGTEVESFTLSGPVTTAGAAVGGFGRPGGGRGRP